MSPKENALPVRDNNFERVGFLWRTFFIYVLGVFRQVYNSPGDLLNSKDLPLPPARLLPEKSVANLSRIWDEERVRASKSGKEASLVRALIRYVGADIGVTVALSWCGIAFNMCIALFTTGIVRAMDGTYSPATGYFIAFLTYLCLHIGCLFLQHAMQNQACVSMMMSGALNGMIFRKPAKITSSERSKYTEGQLVNLSMVDCQTVLEVGLFLGFFLIVPLQVVLSVVFLYLLLGPPLLLGLGILIFNVFLVEREGNQVKVLQMEKNVLADKRNTVLNESLQGVRTVKLLSWERFIGSRVAKLRAVELKNLHSAAFHRAVQAFFSFGLPTLATVATFIVYEYLGNDLDAGTVFTCVGLFEYLGMSLIILPNLINELRRMHVSVTRIQGFLRETDNYQPSLSSADCGVVRVTRGSFFWQEETEEPEEKVAGVVAAGTEAAVKTRSTEPSAQPLTLRNINFEAKKGELVAVVGTVGSGKTTLGQAILGLVSSTNDSKVFVGGRTAFVAQTAFVMNDSIRENIIFGGEMNEAWYKRCISACQLEPDLDVFMAGDETQ
eukprot:gene27085-33319_t